MGRSTFKKRITSDEKIVKINNNNKKLIESFLKAKSRTCSEATVKSYRSDLMIFFCWLVDNGNEDYIKVKKRIISDFFTFIQDELQCHGKRFAHFRSVLSELSSYCIKFYEDDELGNFRNFINSIIETPNKAEVREKTVLSEEQVEFLLNTLKDAGRLQEACLISILSCSGMRISEVQQMRVSWINEESLAYDGLFYKTTEKFRTKGRGKEGKIIDRLILHDPFKPYFDAWIEKREEILKTKEMEDHDYLFINRSGEPASQDVIRNFIDKTSQLIEVEGYPHMYRHYYCTLLKNKYSCSDEFVRTVVRWQSNDLVNLYNDNYGMDGEDWEEISQIKSILNNTTSEKGDD